MKQTLIHGGNWADYQAEYGCQPLDFSANISPLGMPAGVRQAIIEAIPMAERYPDPLCRKLRTAIMEKEGLSFGHCLCGNGAADLIFRLAAAVRPKKAILTAPCFAEYEQALRTVGCEIERYILQEENDFYLQADFLEYIRPDIDMVFLCEPNNPTGITTPKAFLRQILQRCRETGTMLVLDECFNDFLEKPEKHTMKAFLREYPNLFLLKAFTKMYAMAGVRLGYCLFSDDTLAEKLWQAGQPWSVSALAQAAGLAALQEEIYVKKVRCLISAERRRMQEELENLGFYVINGEANYLLFRSERKLTEPLRRKGILLRGCGNYHGLDDSWYRTAVRTHAENERLLLALKEVLA